jgi:molecular chaperone GrpE
MTDETKEQSPAPEAPAPEAAVPAGDTAAGFTPGLTREQQLEAELAEAQDRYMRNLAETENFKKRVARERVEERAFAAQEVVLGLLPLVDNLERALGAAKAQGSEGDQPLLQFEKGVELVLRQFDELLRKQGVNAVEAAKGQAFDPNVHQALLQEASTEHPEGSILEVLQKGYRLGDRLLRPALVKVASAP